MPTNPVLAPSSHIHGLPDFPSISDDDFVPAFDIAMAEHRREVDLIATDPRPPTFANTIEALERAGRGLAQAGGIFFNLVGPDTNPARNAIAKELAPRLTEHANSIALNRQLFSRIETLHRTLADLGLDEPSSRLVERRFRDAVRAGAALDDAGQQEMREISSRLSTLTTTFSQFVLDDSNASAVLFDDATQLDGLSASAISSAADAATAAEHEGKFLLPLDLPTSQSALASLTDPESRRRVFEASIGRCSRGNDFDTREMILEITSLRARSARLLGYRDHAEYVIAEQTAPDADAVQSLLSDLVTAAMRAGGRELTRLHESSSVANGSAPIAPSDITYRLAVEQRRNAAVSLDDFSDYCELDRVLTDGVFSAARALYGLQMVERPELPTYHPDVRTWEVFDSDGVSVGLFIGDFYSRPSKRGGAWMNNVVDQSQLLASRPIVVNVLNLTKPQAGSPCLLSFDQLTTLFHEFGHALHGLLSAVRYASQSGTNVPRDFVEFPSQVNEMWALHPTVLAGYARHHETGEAMPTELADAARETTSVESAHSTIEYLAAAVLDLAWHRITADDDVIDVETFETDALAVAGVASDLIPPRYRTAYFNHIFGGGYSAGYYSYIWSEVLDAETEQWFLSNGGLTRANGTQFADATLSRGDSVDPIAAHRELLGREAEITPLLRRRGLEQVAG